MKIQASSISRAMNCPGSLTIENGLEYGEGYQGFAGAADFGNRVHKAGEDLLRSVFRDQKRTPAKTLKVNGFERNTPDYDRADHIIKSYKKYVNKIYKKHFKRGLILKGTGTEQKYRVDINGFDCVCKTDTIIMSRTENKIYIDIFDLKTGNFNYSISAGQQLLFSLEIIMEHFNAAKKNLEWVCGVHIVQPGYYDETLQTFGSIESFKPDFIHDTLIKRVDTIARYSDRFNPCDDCKFCRGILSCPAMHFNLHLISSFMEAHEHSPEDIPKDRLEMIWHQRQKIESFLKAVDQKIYKDIDDGGTYSGLHLESYSGHRQWIDKKYAIKKLKYLGQRIFEAPKLKSPAQIEKIAGKENIIDLFSKTTLWKVAPYKNDFEGMDE